jgi:hypothetical protein
VAGVDAKDGLAGIVITVKDAGARLTTVNRILQKLNVMSEREANPFHGKYTARPKDLVVIFHRK